jgi:hypothetical protein
MGVKRSGTKRSFISTTVDTVDEFYADVVQHLSEWQVAAPKLNRSATESSAADVVAEPKKSEQEGQSDPLQKVPSPVWPVAGTWESQ